MRPRIFFEKALRISSMSEPIHVKVGFYLEQDEDGWPPVTRENILAVDLGGGRYRIDNIPFYVRGISDGDVIAAEPEDDGRLSFSELVKDGFISLHIPGSVAIRPIAPLIERGEEDGRWDFEEGALRHPNSGFSY